MHANMPSARVGDCEIVSDVARQACISLGGLLSGIEAYLMANMETKTVADVFVHHFISHFGVPDSLYTDQGCNFKSSLLKEICQILGVTKTRTTPYHPLSDGF